jgi:uncharacterized protein
LGVKLLKVIQEEKEEIIKAIVQHSEKKIYFDDPFIELLKDVDSLDGYLHGVKAEGARLDRCKIAIKELGIKG